ncbi:hypothetical protein GBF38_016687, partial [Nibea albiflora]
LHLKLYFLTLTPGSTKHSITLTGQDDGKGPIVKDLSDALTQATGVPQTSQKLLIFFHRVSWPKTSRQRRWDGVLVDEFGLPQIPAT